MSEWLKSQYRIPSFKGFRPFRPLEPASEEEELSGAASDPTLRPEEQGTIKRYLRYADTLINGPEITGPETSSEETPADNETVREVSLLGGRKSKNKDKAA
jgi:hypothetical protein